MIGLFLCEHAQEEFARLVAVVRARDDDVVTRWHAEAFGDLAPIDVRTAGADTFELVHVEFQIALFEILLNVDALLDLRINSVQSRETH